MAFSERHNETVVFHYGLYSEDGRLLKEISKILPPGVSYQDFAIDPADTEVAWIGIMRETKRLVGYFPARQFRRQMPDG